MPDISELVTITRRELVPGSEFDSSYGMDEEFFSSISEELPPGLSRTKIKEKLHPTISELWICDIGCGVQMVLPYIKGEVRLSSGEKLFFPIDITGYTGQVLPYMSSFSEIEYEMSEGIELEGGLKIYGIDGISADCVKLANDVGMDRTQKYFYIIGKFCPGESALTDLSVGYGQVADPLLQVDIKGQPTEGYKAEFRKCKNSKAMPLPAAGGPEVDFYETVKALVDFGVHGKGDLKEVLRFSE